VDDADGQTGRVAEEGILMEFLGALLLALYVVVGVWVALTSDKDRD
jgi:hypothetical protein